ncbi:MAG: lipoprotein [Lautropia sp.]|nr:lipoprotein [Lautropia sp.]
MHHCILIALLATSLLAGCGQKGPLYLPEALPDTDTQASVQPAH